MEKLSRDKDSVRWVLPTAKERKTLKQSTEATPKVSLIESERVKRRRRAKFNYSCKISPWDDGALRKMWKKSFVYAWTFACAPLQGCDSDGDLYAKKSAQVWQIWVEVQDRLLCLLLMESPRLVRETMLLGRNGNRLMIVNAIILDKRDHLIRFWEFNFICNESLIAVFKYWTKNLHNQV